MVDGCRFVGDRDDVVAHAETCHYHLMGGFVSDTKNAIKVRTPRGWDVARTRELSCLAFCQPREVTLSFGLPLTPPPPPPPPSPHHRAGSPAVGGCLCAMARRHDRNPWRPSGDRWPSRGQHCKHAAAGIAPYGWQQRTAWPTASALASTLRKVRTSAVVRPSATGDKAQPLVGRLRRVSSYS